MKYDVKVKINGVEVIQNINADVEVSTPYISELKLKSSTSLKGLDIGSTASDSIYFTMYNPFKPYFDGDKVELFILENYEDEQGKDSELAEEVGSQRTTDVFDSLDIETEVNYTEEDEEEEEITDTATITALTNETNAITASVLDMIDGDSETTETTTTTGEVEGWQKLGTYYVVSAKLSDDNSIVSIEAHDGFSKLNIKYEPVNVTCTIQQAYDDFRAKVLSEFKIVVDEMDLSEYDTKTFNFKGRYTYRTFLGYIAGMLGGFATFGLDDTLGISYYNFSDKILLSDELIDFQDTAGGGITIDSIVCDRATSIFKQDLISTDDNPESDGDIIFYNPYVDQDLLNEIFEDLHGISYTGGKATAMWSPALESGSFLRIMDDEEYKNYLQLRNELSANTSMTTDKKNELKANIVGVGKTILITNQTISFAGDAITQIDSVLPSVYKKEAQIMSPNDAKFEHLYAEMIEADYIDAVKVVTEALIAKNAEIQDLVVQSINGHSIKNTYILAKALSDEALLTAYGIQTFYTAIDPRESHEVKDGDLWWVTVRADDCKVDTPLNEYRNGDWQPVDPDYRSFKANFITALEIAANSIDASKLNVGDLSAISSRFGNYSKWYEINGNGLVGKKRENAFFRIDIPSELANEYVNCKRAEENLKNQLNTTITLFDFKDIIIQGIKEGYSDFVKQRLAPNKYIYSINFKYDSDTEIPYFEVIVTDQYSNAMTFSDICGFDSIERIDFEYVITKGYWTEHNGNVIFIEIEEENKNDPIGDSDFQEGGNNLSYTTQIGDVAISYRATENTGTEIGYDFVRTDNLQGNGGQIGGWKIVDEGLEVTKEYDTDYGSHVYGYTLIDNTLGDMGQKINMVYEEDKENGDHIYKESWFTPYGVDFYDENNNHTNVSAEGVFAPNIKHGSLPLYIPNTDVVTFEVIYDTPFPYTDYSVTFSPRHASGVSYIYHKVLTKRADGFTGYVRSAGGGNHVIEWIAIG